MNAPTPTHGASVDAQNPWLGLVSFTEETRSFFHGREEEVAELGRRVQRRLLTVLFGQSGLGKTSILQAGLVPRLRMEGYCPVYVRLDYDPHSPPPAEQIKRIVMRATAAVGTWTRSGSAVAGETLWEFLHHREDVLQDAGGRTLTPLLIFDQFEEIFTLAQVDDAGRRRAQEFLTDLADLVENRPPASLETRIERDEADAAQFDFARADYRILISLREDYLAHLEGLKSAMPAVTQNRMRLARMTGTQALAAVRRPAPALVSETVAESIVSFVAGGAGLAVAEVEPSLLSLICRELNNARLARGQPEISADLLAGSRETILSEFYERSLAGEPEGVRLVVEDEMLTDSGFRESVAEERVRKGFAAAGAAPETLARLVDRRLLRVEDRLDQRRVEITHDVLCSVIAASRAVRREREALEESQRQLAAQRAHEAATRRSLTRARTVAVVASALLLLAAGSAVFGWINLRRARAAERVARETRAQAERARAEAEKIVGYLVDDFYRELEPTGNTDIVADLAARAASYYRNLPSELRTRETQRNHGLTLARYGAVLNSLNRTDEAAPVLAESVALLLALVQSGDDSPETADGLSLAYRMQSILLSNQQLTADSLPVAAKATETLRAAATAPGAHLTIRTDYAQALTMQGFYIFRLGRQDNFEQAGRLFTEARRIVDAARQEAPGNVHVLSLDALLGVREAALASLLGESEAALRIARASQENCRRVLEIRPGYLSAINVLGIGLGVESNLLYIQGQTSQSLAVAEQSAAQYEQFVRLSPHAGLAWGNLSGARDRIAGRLQALGRLREANDVRRSMLALEGKITMSSQQAGIFAGISSRIAWFEAEFGNTEAAEKAVAETMRLYDRSTQDEGLEGIGRLIRNDLNQLLQLTVRTTQSGTEQEVLASAQAIWERADQLVVKDDVARGWQATIRSISNDLGYVAARRSERWREAESWARRAIAVRQERGVTNDNGRAELAFAQVDLAEALARQQRLPEARQLLAQAGSWIEAMLPRFAEHQTRRVSGAKYHLVLALLAPDDRATRRAHVQAARQLLNGISDDLRSTEDVRRLFDWIAREEAAGPT
jgi:tetratricopeptide (TPR) repeat protein